MDFAATSKLAQEMLESHGGIGFESVSGLTPLPVIRDAGSRSGCYEQLAPIGRDPWIRVTNSFGFAGILSHASF